MKRGKYKTDIERLMEKALLKEDISYVYDFPIRVVGYRIDFLILPRDLKICIECDGERWHPIGNRHDKLKDNYLKKNGYMVLRFRGEQIHNNLSNCLATIKDAIKYKQEVIKNESNKNTSSDKRSISIVNESFCY